MTPSDVLEFARENECHYVDVKFLDFAGVWQHLCLPVQTFGERTFAEGIVFDGAAVPSWRARHAADLLLIPDPATARLDPFPKARTLSLIADLHDPLTGDPHPGDPRRIARRAEELLKKSGVADTARFAPEVEFFVFDDVRFDQTRNSAFHYVDSDEGRWNTGRDEGPNLGYKPRHKEGAFPTPPTDSLVDLRQEMVGELSRLGIRVMLEHHEIATGGQGEIALAEASLLEQADNLQWLRYILKNVARRSGKTLTFMPKPIFEDNGSSMHCPQSLWKGGENLFSGEGYAALSDKALWYVGGLLRHAPALTALLNPTVNSYRRLAPGYDAPTDLLFSRRCPTAAVRVPARPAGPEARRVELRTPDPSANGYLAFAAMLLAGLDGIRNRIDPGEPFDGDVEDLPEEKAAAVPTTPASLDEALAALEEDREFLVKDGVFSEAFLARFIRDKTENEIESMRQRPTPWEFALYYDC